MLWLSPVEYKSDKTTCKVSSVSGPATLQDARLNSYFTSWVCICIRKIELIEQLQSSISGPAARCKTEQLFKQIDTEEYTCNTYKTSQCNMIVHSLLTTQVHNWTTAHQVHNWSTTQLVDRRKRIQLSDCARVIRLQLPPASLRPAAALML